MGYDGPESEVECCGMAGSFGYETEYYEMSVDVGDRLRELTVPEARDRIVAASGTSCEDYLGSLLERDAVHPVECSTRDSESAADDSRRWFTFR